MKLVTQSGYNFVQSFWLEGTQKTVQIGVQVFLYTGMYFPPLYKLCCIWKMNAETAGIDGTLQKSEDYYLKPNSNFGIPTDFNQSEFVSLFWIKVVGLFAPFALSGFSIKLNMSRNLNNSKRAG